MSKGSAKTDPIEAPAAPKVLRTTYVIGTEPSSLERLGCPFAAWREKCIGNRPPMFSDIDVIEDFIGDHDRIALGEVRDGQIICRLLGTTFEELVGRDITGENFLDQMTADDKPALDEYFEKIVKSGHIGHAIGALPVTDRDFMQFETLDLPLMGDDGVSHILGTLMVFRD